MKVTDFFDTLDIGGFLNTEGDLVAHSPVDGAEIARVMCHTPAEAGDMMDRAGAAFRAWRHVPAPTRGELVRLYGEELRKAKEPLGRLVSAECGKIL